MAEQLFEWLSQKMPSGVLKKITPRKALRERDRREGRGIVEAKKLIYDHPANKAIKYL